MRHWIVGTGKSLLDTPLDLLKGEITWGMNRIHKYYDRTDWRPTYYAFVDLLERLHPGTLEHPQMVMGWLQRR
jgi:hypothetical protein